MDSFQCVVTYIILNIDNLINKKEKKRKDVGKKGRRKGKEGEERGKMRKKASKQPNKHTTKK